MDFLHVHRDLARSMDVINEAQSCIQNWLRHPSRTTGRSAQRDAIMLIMLGSMLLCFHEKTTKMKTKISLNTGGDATDDDDRL